MKPQETLIRIDIKDEIFGNSFTTAIHTEKSQLILYKAMRSFDQG